MKQLVIHLVSSTAVGSGRVRIEYRPEAGGPVQEWSHAFHFLLSESQRRELEWYFAEYLQQPWEGQGERAKKIELGVQQLGAELFGAVFGGSEAGALYAQVADDLANTQFVIQSEPLVGETIPWEFLRDPARGDYGDLARVAGAFRRGSPLPHESVVPRDLPEGALNILLVIASPVSEPVRSYESIMLALLELFRGQKERLHLDILTAPDAESLAVWLVEKRGFYHVLHVEGSLRTAISSSPGGSNAGNSTEADRVVTLPDVVRLVPSSQIPVVFLDPLTGSASEGSTSGVSLAQRLHQAGVSGVITHQFGLGRDSRVRFWSRLYEGLANGEELSRALTEARLELQLRPQRFSPVGELPLWDWLTPVGFQSRPVQFASPVFRPVHLSPNLLRGRQATAAAEIDCPPPPVHGLVGREAHLMALEMALARHTVVLLEGPSGIGKTETALGFARWWSETTRYGGPVFFFRFNHYVPLARICDQVGEYFRETIQTQSQKDWALLGTEARQSAALEMLRQRSCLLIGDNFESVAGYPSGVPSAWSAWEQKLLREFLRQLQGGRTRVILTSRRDEPWLGDDYQRLVLPGLSLVEAQELAVRVFRAADFSHRQIRSLPPYNDLLTFLHGNPLAVEILAPDLRRKTPEALSQCLGGSSDWPAAELAFASVLKYRFETLDPALRRRLGVLGLFQGYVSARVLTAMGSLAGAPENLRELGREDWVRLLEAAVHLGLLRRESEGACLIHPALQPRFHELLLESYPDDLEWLERAFCTVIGRAGNQLFQIFQANAELAGSMLRREQYNLMHAYRLARRHLDWANLKEILCGLRVLLTTLGRWTEWEQLVSELEVEAAGARKSLRPDQEILWLRVLGHRAEICEYRRDLDTLRALHLGLKKHYQLAGERHHHEDILDDLGLIAEQRRQGDEAERFYLKSLALKQQSGDQKGQAGTLRQLGDLAAQQRNFREAEKWYRQALALWERVGEEDPQATLFCRLGAVDQERGEFDEAAVWYEKSLAIRAKLGDQKRQALALHQLGRMAHEQKLHGIAAQRYQESLALRRQIGDDQGEAATLHQMGRMARDQKHYPEAETLFHQALEIRERLGDEAGQAQSLHQLGNVAWLQGHVEAAEPFYQRSLRIRERGQDVHGQARNLNQLAKIAEARGDAALAEHYYHRAEALRPPL